MLDQLDIKEPLPSYSPTLYRITGGKGEAVALAQLIYKCGNCNWGTVRMSSSDWANELQLSRREFENLNNCITTLSLGTIEVVYIGYVKKLAYTLYKQAIIEAIKDGNVIYDVRNKLRIVTSEVTHSNVTNDVPIRNKLRTYTSEVTYIKDIKSNKSNEEIKEPFSEINSLLPKTDLVKKEMAERIERGEAAKTKPKKPKELSPLDKEIALKIQEVGKRFIKWYEAHKKTPYLSKKHDFINLTATFSQLCNNKGYTPDMVVKDIEKIVNGYSKLKEFNQNNISLNLIATKYNVLLSEIDSYKAPVERKNFNEPVPFVPAIKEKIDYYNTMPLPVGLSDEVFRELGEAIYREKIMDEEVDPKEIGISQFTEIIYKQVRTMNQQQIQHLLETYGIV